MSGDLFAPAPRPARTATGATPRWKVCCVCGKHPVGLGFGASVLRKTIGRWSCLAHRDQVERMAG